jgi:hypothetical protein
MSPNNKPVTIIERWTRTGGIRKIGNGPWESIDLTPLGGIVPFLIVDPKIRDWETQTLVSSREAALMAPVDLDIIEPEFAEALRDEDLGGL